MLFVLPLFVPSIEDVMSFHPFSSLISFTNGMSTVNEEELSYVFFFSSDYIFVHFVDVLLVIERE